MEMRKGIYFVLGVYILWSWGAAFGETFKTFRGIQWGADKKDVPGLIAGPQSENVEVYTRNENKKVGDIDVQSIYYMFYKGKLGAARILFQGASNSSILKEALHQKYGPSQKPEHTELLSAQHWGCCICCTTHLPLSSSGGWAVDMHSHHPAPLSLQKAPQIIRDPFGGK